MLLSVMKQHDLYYFEAIEMMSEVLSQFTESTCLSFTFSIQNFIRLVALFTCAENSIGQAFPQNRR